MSEINYLAVVVASLAALAVSSLWYIVFARQRRELRHQELGSPGNSRRPQPVKMLIEIARNLVLASVIAYLILHLGITDWTGAILFGILARIGFPVILLTGSIMWENVPWKLAAIHAGDWLLKLLLLSLILAAWR